MLPLAISRASNTSPAQNITSDPQMGHVEERPTIHHFGNLRLYGSINDLSLKCIVGMLFECVV